MLVTVHSVQSQSHLRIIYEEFVGTVSIGGICAAGLNEWQRSPGATPLKSIRICGSLMNALAFRYKWKQLR